MKLLVPERMQVFSPALAATIGLEEAILLHLLHDLAAARGQGPAPGWLEVEPDVLQRLLPFWSLRDLQRISRSLADKGVLRMDAPLDEQRPLRVAFDEPAPARERMPRAPATATAAAPLRPRGASSLSALWQPDEDLLQLLALNHGIPRQFALDQLEDFRLYWRETGKVSHAWASRFRQHVLRQWRLQEQQVREEEPPPLATAGSALGRDWQPSPDALQILERGGISRDFIEDAVPEFVLYWRERGEGSGTWNSKFIAHIRRQWARYANALEHDQEPRPLAANWQPSEDVYDILRMANIDLPFAREVLPEFILFWRDAGTAHRSWNTKFLQHVKYQWATRHHLQVLGGARQSAGALAAPSSTFEQLTDRSWAAGLVDGL